MARIASQASWRSDHLAARSLNPCGGIAFGMKRVIGHQGNSLSESGGRGAKRSGQPGKVEEVPASDAGCGGKTGEVAKARIRGEALQRGKPSAPLPVGQRAAGRGALPTLSRGTQLGLARRVLDDAAGKARRGEDVQPMRLADLGVKLAHHIEVQRGMTTDRQEPAFLDAMLVDHEMRMQMVGVLVKRRDVAPDIPILTGPEHRLPHSRAMTSARSASTPAGKLRTM